jgi:NADH-quinone oxidoreductase subunit G
MATVNPVRNDLVTLEIDGQAVEAPKGSMIIEAADRIGIDIPRFCYHHKLSIAANCRMCLVDVEKAPKPLPACATPVADGMKVFTESRRAVDAQRGVMEFLLINHPLDCPICDQGGECELQDLAMGYGRSVSRFTERKRVVKDKNLGPLVATDMTRCIHCTRCVRFLEEIAGTAELGGIGRGEHTEISTFVERNIQSELSGNIIDLCPVGALTNKPFRFSARPWEMRARPMIASHDCVGSNLFYHVRGHKIMRCVPRENESVNECWLADRDRYSHFGLSADDRLTAPRIKVDGQWQDCEWATALEAAETALRSAIDSYGPEHVGILASPRATSEEHFLLSRLAKGLGVRNVDHRLRLADTRHTDAGRARMDVSSAELADADTIFLIGSNIRQDQPILGHRVRTAWRRRNATIMDLNPVAYEFHFDLAERLTVAPRAMVGQLAGIVRAAIEASGGDFPKGSFGEWLRKIEMTDECGRIVSALRAAEKPAILLGDIALNHPEGSTLRALAECLADGLDLALCVLPGPANSEGAWRAGMTPHASGLSATQMLEDPRRVYLLVDFEPSMDTANPAAAVSALGAADQVIAVSTFASPDLLAHADVLLPMAASAETMGSYTNLDGLSQAFKAAIKPPGQAREGWRIFRRLGEMLGLDGFDFVSLESVVDSLHVEELDRSAHPAFVPDDVPDASEGLSRVGDVPMFAGDVLLRRSRPLQQTSHSDGAVARVHPNTAERLNLSGEGRVRVSQGAAEADFQLVIDPAIAVDAVWLPSSVTETSGLSLSYGPIRLEAISA